MPAAKATAWLRNADVEEAVGKVSRTLELVPSHIAAVRTATFESTLHRAKRAALTASV